MTRLEWVKWVYHHPEQTEKLVELLLQIDTSLIIDRLQDIEQNDIKQDSEIDDIRANGINTSITLQQLAALLSQDPEMDDIPESQLQSILGRLNLNDIIDAQQDQRINELEDNDTQAISREQLDNLLNIEETEGE